MILLIITPLESATQSLQKETLRRRKVAPDQGLGSGPWVPGHASRAPGLGSGPRARDPRPGLGSGPWHSLALALMTP